MAVSAAELGTTRNWISPLIEWRLLRMRGAHAPIATNIWLTWVFYLMSFMETFRCCQKQAATMYHCASVAFKQTPECVQNHCALCWHCFPMIFPVHLCHFSFFFPSRSSYFRCCCSSLFRPWREYLLDPTPVRASLLIHSIQFNSLMLRRAHFTSTTHI